MTDLVSNFNINGIPVQVYSSKLEMGRASASYAASILRETIARQGQARIVVGTGASQLELIHALTEEPGVDWNAIEVFHMDEYVGMPMSHTASFRGWLKTHLADVVQCRQVHYVQGDAQDLEGEIQRYAGLLQAAPIDITFIGFGENGHIAFNDPHEANFRDPKIVKRVKLDERCRMQQVREGAFPNLEEVPSEAITITCPALVSAKNLICSVPEKRKAEAVRNALEGPLSEKCPASLVLTHPHCAIFLDIDSASLLKNVTR